MELKIGENRLPFVRVSKGGVPYAHVVEHVGLNHFYSSQIVGSHLYKANRKEAHGEGSIGICVFDM